MSRITEQFVRLRKQGRIALVPFFTAGYPTPKIFMELVKEAAKRGASVIEIGIPFSDPLADGPTIQYSSQQVLNRHITLAKVLKMLRVLNSSDIGRRTGKSALSQDRTGFPTRSSVGVPLVIMSYYNPIWRFGPERFCQQAKRAGVSGLIIPDLPPDEGNALEKKARQYGLDLIYLLAPNATKQRIRLVTRHSQGFVYLVSVTGVTGAREKLPPELLTFIKRVRQTTRKPLCVGFGVSKPQQIKTLRKSVDGVIIGSAIIDLIRREKSESRVVAKVGNFIEQLYKGTMRLL